MDDGSEPLGRRVLEGALSGLIATAPMSVLMLVGYRVLPRSEQYELPPRRITERLVSRSHPTRRVPSEAVSVATLVGHFGYGAASGAAYGALTPRPQEVSSLRGAGFGLAVWAGSYFGWLPAAKILPAPTRKPAGRNVLMVAAHLVWGSATGILARWLAERT